MEIEQADPEGPLFGTICGTLAILVPVFPVLDAFVAFIWRRASETLRRPAWQCLCSCLAPEGLSDRTMRAWGTRQASEAVAPVVSLLHC